MPDSENDASGLHYSSQPLAALLRVFSNWGSEQFMTSLAAGAGYELDSTSIVAITVLGQEGAVRPSALAERLRVGSSNVSKIAARLIDAGLAIRIPDATDARANLLTLTVAGVALMDDLVAAGDRMMAEILTRWSETDRGEFTRLVQRFERDVATYRPDAGRWNSGR
ncbi:MarR family winged helix-turn-helix transcriptional regulator [Leifsonia sp. A12D58]|uniref:MarR family winged helix-turn-helix transcriptional regulator n=1 Tax=Leifsonia sp. A12D58 TaxID=3397674 RepID=UPI0039DFCA4B